MDRYDRLSDAQKEFLQKSVDSVRENGNTSFELNRWGGLWSIVGQPNGGGFEGPGAEAGSPQMAFTFFEELADLGFIQIERLSGRSWKYTLTQDVTD
jgi:hypothetical protein